jgi:hypothetical protein
VVDAELAAERAVDHRQQRRRDVDVPHAAHVAARDPAAEIAHDAAADIDDHIAPRDRGLGEPAQ